MRRLFHLDVVCAVIHAVSQLFDFAADYGDDNCRLRTCTPPTTERIHVPALHQPDVGRGASSRRLPSTVNESAARRAQTRRLYRPDDYAKRQGGTRSAEECRDGHRPHVSTEEPGVEKPVRLTRTSVCGDPLAH